MTGIDSEGIKKAVEGSDGGAAQRVQYEAEQLAENAREAAASKGHPRVMSSGGAHDDTTVYSSEVTLEFDTKEEALAAVDAARADGRHVSQIDGGNYVVESGGGWSAAIELDKNARYSTSDHTGGR